MNSIKIQIKRHYIKALILILSILGISYSCKKDDGPNDNNNDTTIVAMYGVPAAQHIELDMTVAENELVTTIKPKE